jgi:hypothetical protein
MRMRLLGIAFAVLLELLIGGCENQVEQRPEQTEIQVHDTGVEAAPLSTYIDSDDDGLCDSSERVAGTSIENPDSDGDSYPDVIEVAYGFNALDPNAPRDEQVVSLVEASGASVTLIAQVQVEGVGEQYTGLFESFDPISSQTTTAADLLVGVRAIAADPPDNVHGIEENAARFASVKGLTELTFSLRFAYDEQSTSECKRGYPFSFSAKRPDRSQVGTERYLLISIPTESNSVEVSWCIPEPCL